MVSPEFEARIAALEEKGLIRRVRTAAGALAFGQPIGTIITRDVIPNRREPRKKRTRGKRTHRATSSVQAYKAPREERGKDRRWVKVGTTIHGLPVPSHATEYIATTSDGFKMRRRWQQGMQGSRVFYTRVDSAHEDDGQWAIADSENDTYSLVEAQLHAARTRRHNTTPQRRKRDYDGLMDHYDGVYGVDWLAEEDDVEYDFTNFSQRLTAAATESERLGISVDGAADYTGDYYFDPNVHETINGVMRAYEDMYPGFARFIPQFKLDVNKSAAGSDWVAYNRPNYNVDVEAAPTAGYPVARRAANVEAADFDGAKRDYDYTVIAFNPATFSDGSPDIYRKMEQNANNAWAAKFSTFDVAEFSKQNNLTTWQGYTMYAINHEIGHTVARMAFGEMVSGKGHDNAYFQNSFLFQMESIWKKHNIIPPDEDLSRATTTTQLSTSDPGWSVMRVNSAILSAQLSTYGATNMHEMMAETWVAYMMDPEPTEFVREAGAVLDELLIQWLEDFDSREENNNVA